MIKFDKNTKLFMVFALISVVAVSFSLTKDYAKAAPFVFGANLKYGDVSPDVIELQKILNQSADTRVALSGPGSPGEETDYFGALTETAVIKFQEKYKGEILVPWGLNLGSGFVGVSTRAKLNSILAGGTIQAIKEVNNATSSSVALNESPADIASILSSLPTSSAVNNNHASSSYLGPPLIENLSGIDFSPGDSLTITGAGFTGSVSVHVGDQVYNNPKVISDSIITVTVPNEDGVLFVWVGNEIGDSREEYPMFIVSRDKSVNNPIIPGVLEKIQENNAIINQNALKALSN